MAKYAKKRIRNAIDQFQLEKDNGLFWQTLNDIRSTFVINDFEIMVYLSLIARRKNDKITDGKCYFRFHA